MRTAIALVLVLALVPPALAAAGPPMQIAGTVRVNGDSVPNGTSVLVLGASGVVLARSTAGAAGTVAFDVPADDPDTTAREGAQPHESLSLRALGATVAAGAFESGTSRALDVDLQLPRLVIMGVRGEPGLVEVGESTSVLATVANQGNATAAAVRVIVSEAATSGTLVVGDVPPGQSRSIAVRLNASGPVGEHAFGVQAASASYDADPTGARSQGIALVQVRADPPPVIVSFTAVPPAPAPGQPVTLEVNATDDDGVTFVDLQWRDATFHHANLTTGPPYRVVIGPLDAGVISVDAWALVGEANGQTTTTRHLIIGAGGTTNASTPATPVSGTPPSSSPLPTGASRVPLPRSSRSGSSRWRWRLNSCAEGRRPPRRRRPPARPARNRESCPRWLALAWRKQAACASSW